MKRYTPTAKYPIAIEKRMAAMGRLPSDIDGDTPPLRKQCPYCEAHLTPRESEGRTCSECGGTWYR